MEQELVERIRRFETSQEVTELPSILVGLQESEGVSERIRYENQMMWLRDMAVCEPTSLIKQLETEKDNGSKHIILQTYKGMLVLNMIDFMIWMIDMFMQTDEEEYLILLKGMYRFLYKRGVDKLQEVHAPLQFKSDETTPLLLRYYAYVEYMYKNYGLIRKYPTSNAYYKTLYKISPGRFFKEAIPDMMPLALVYMTDNVNLRLRDNLEFFTELYVLRGEAAK